MKSVILNFIGINYCKVELFLYQNHNLIYYDSTCLGRFEVDLCQNQVYELIAISGHDIIRVFFFVDDRTSYYFYFSSGISKITFHLYDSFYKNLLIQKGEIILWQK